VFALILVFVIGLCVGSFLNVVILRLRAEKTIGGRSECPSCHHILSAKDLIPVVSYLLLKGKCQYCTANISWQYPLVEFATACLFVLAFILKPEPPYFIGAVVFLSVLLVIFVYDLRWYLIPDRVTIPAILAAFAYNIWLFLFAGPCTTQLFSSCGPHAIIDLLIAAGVGGGFFLIQYIVSQGRWIGGGDIRLGILMGALLSWPLVLAALFFAYISGALVGLGLLFFKKRTFGQEVPFGPFLTASTALVLLFDQEIRFLLATFYGI
jgi:leader peptidase (prepilin peptidase) / N-methyltransferase